MVVRVMRDAEFAAGPTEDASGGATNADTGAGSARSSFWYELTDEHSVFEFRPATASGSLLALHVVIDADADATIAWWEADNGMWVVQVGSA